MSYLFPDFSLAFFREISEQASRQLATKEQRKFCKHAKRRNWRYYNMSKNETPQRETKWTLRLLKVSRSVRLQAYVRK